MQLFAAETHKVLCVSKKPNPTTFSPRASSHDDVPPTSDRRSMLLCIEWLPSKLHARSGSHSAHVSSRQIAVELSQSVPGRDGRTNSRSPTSGVRIPTDDASASDRKRLDDVWSARGDRSIAPRSATRSQDRERRPAMTIGRIGSKFTGFSRCFGETSPFGPTDRPLDSPPL